MNGIVSNAEEVNLINRKSEMLLHPRTRKPNAVFWIILVLVLLFVYYFSVTNTKSETETLNVNPKLLVNGHDVNRQPALQEQNAPVMIDVGGANVPQQQILQHGQPVEAVRYPVGVNQPPVNQQPLNQQPVNQQPLNQQPLNQQPVNQQPLNQQPLNQQPLNQQPVNQQPLQQAAQYVVEKKPAKRGGFANPLPLHQEPELLRPEIAGKFLDLGHGLQVRKDANPDYIDAVLNNQNADNVPVIPRFNPNKHVQNKRFEDFADVKRPDPKSFPVGLYLRPTSCEAADLVVLVTTTVKEAHLRSMIRRTWGKKANVDKPETIVGNWKIYFLMGRPRNSTDNEAIVKESQLNNDIIQGDFIDMLEETTRKVLMGMQWVVDSNCQPPHILRAETDMYINIPSLLYWLTTQTRGSLYIGHVVRRNVPNRDVESPYYIPETDYPRSTLPDYANAPVYLISYNYVTQFLKAIPSVTPVAMDGVYIGLLAESQGIKPIHSEHFVLMKRPSNVCVYKHMFFIFKISEGELIHIYHVVERHLKDRECGRTDF
ncbi:beta-1,3-galactosyltransferase 1-like [Antedon mediterranea]|uniref:beta-1,3-galactosyltransferase 1-like n=1 Tax=Antedon mediterranea TaxID=105859 RepID=UPI003AF4966C